MADTKKVMQTVLFDEKLKNSKSMAKKVYKDEPILMTAAQMANYTPPKYREMRKIAKSSSSCYQSSEMIFYKQGKFMEDFEDDFDYRGELRMIFPTYQAMSDQQLRGYFSWRTKVRRGIIEKTFLPYSLLYVFELLNQIGTDNPVDGYNKLKNFWQVYRVTDAQIDRFIKPWLMDYVIYYNLDKSLLAELFDDTLEKALLVLLEYQVHSAEQVFNALNYQSAYNFEKSRFYKDHSEDVKNVVWLVFAELSEYYSKNHKKSFFQKVFGFKQWFVYYMFGLAVFYDHNKRDDYVYEINDVYRIKCENGRWKCERFAYNLDYDQKIGNLLKSIDYHLRQKYDYKYPLKPVKTTKTYENIISKAIDKYLEEEKAKNRPEAKINIDVSKLQNIRKTALATQNKLIVQETEIILADAADVCRPQQLIGTAGQENPPSQDNPAGQGNKPGKTTKPPGRLSQIREQQLQPACPAPHGLPEDLDAVQYQFMQCLLADRSYDDLLKANGLLLSVLIDSINEALFDVFSDIVIEYDGDKPQLIEDYTEQLKGIIK